MVLFAKRWRSVPEHRHDMQGDSPFVAIFRS
jgi:hypothetical protein